MLRCCRSRLSPGREGGDVKHATVWDRLLVVSVIVVAIVLVPIWLPVLVVWSLSGRADDTYDDPEW